MGFKTMGLINILRRAKLYLVEIPARMRLLRGIRQLLELPDELLRDEETLMKIIREIGLCYDDRDVYGDESPYMNASGNGLYQLPKQLVKAMIELSRHKIDSFLEVGTYTGYTSSLLTAYLYRFNPELKATTIDPNHNFRSYKKVRSLIPLEHRLCKSETLRGQVFDCVFIDGDHSYQGARRDFENVGKQARICMFHDINDEMVGFENVPRLWKELSESGSSTETHSFLECTPGKQVMGIGILIS
jgi:hypothetical protein